MQNGTLSAMVTLALDVGERRIGVAVADAHGRLATPIGAVMRRDDVGTQAALAVIARERGVSDLLVGVPLGPNGEETARAAANRTFGTTLASALDLPVAFRDERYTTQDALMRQRAASEPIEGRRRGARRPPSPQAREAARRRVDAMAAAILLQSHLDEISRAQSDVSELGGAHALADALLDARWDAEEMGRDEDNRDVARG